MADRYEIVSLENIPAAECPCGFTKRAFVDLPEKIASIHLLTIKIDSRVHYHEKMTEIYLILSGEGYMELDGDQIPVKPMDAIFIRPGCRHRAVGEMTVINIPIPAFDAADEFFDD